MAETLALSKAELVSIAQTRLEQEVRGSAWTKLEKLALTCRILFDAGHDSGLAGQITCRADSNDTFHTQQLGQGFDEIRASSLITVNEDLEVVSGKGVPNPANRFHTWIYRARPEINCIIHTHPTHIAALSMLEVPLIVSHMDTSPLFNDCGFLEKWPGIPVGNEEGEIIAGALGQKRAVLLAHHGQLVVGKTVEEACLLAGLMERAAKLQLLAMAAGTIKPLPEMLATEAHDWVSTAKRDAVTFDYFARRALRNHADCLN
ncbi:aldolase [Robbsia sp. KACC 23696]|uniref:aldolase n=1 Tax=Robbsia sp. KACC 23696 TaxID=3149231 RepID=UPI00325B60FE